MKSWWIKKTHPNPNDHNRRDLSNSESGENEKAIIDFNEALRMTDKNDSVGRMLLLSNKSTAQANLNLLDSALYNINLAIKLYEFPEDILLPNKASILFDSGKAHEALEILEALPPRYKEENLQLIKKCKEEISFLSIISNPKD